MNCTKNYSIILSITCHCLGNFPTPSLPYITHPTPALPTLPHPCMTHPNATWPTPPHPYMTHPTPTWPTPPQPYMIHPTPPLHDPPHPTLTWPTPPFPTLTWSPHPYMTHPTLTWPTPQHPPHLTWPTPPHSYMTHPNLTWPTPPHPSTFLGTKGPFFMGSFTMSPFWLNVNWKIIHSIILYVTCHDLKNSPLLIHIPSYHSWILETLWLIISWVWIIRKRLNVNVEKIDSIILSLTCHSLRNFSLFIHIPPYPFANCRNPMCYYFLSLSYL